MVPTRWPAALGLPPEDAEDAGAAARRLRGQPPTGLWRYVTGTDRTAFHIVRWDLPEGGKTVRTLSWDVLEGWRFAAWRAHRPLFGLGEILRHPEAPVVVCEGERTAEAAAIVFPDRIATTSSCGASEAARTDWTPLAGRQVLIWPDNDEPGAAYGREVASILSALGCAVSLVEPPLLASTAPDGTRRPPAAKWDAADAAAEWRDLDALRAATLASACTAT